MHDFCQIDFMFTLFFASNITVPVSVSPEDYSTNIGASNGIKRIRFGRYYVHVRDCINRACIQYFQIFDAFYFILFLSRSLVVCLVVWWFVSGWSASCLVWLVWFGWFCLVVWLFGHLAG